MGSDAHILVVDDEIEVRELLRDYLTKHGFAVTAAADAVEAREILEQRAVDLAILDLRMPGEDGLSLARHVRDKGSTAILMLTALADTIDRVVGLEIGADDYLAKPFDPRELLARVRSILRRTASPKAEPHAGQDDALRPLRARPPGKAALHASTGEEVPVTAGEMELLEAFADRPNRPLSRDQLLELAHRSDNDPFDRSIDIRIARLRRKVEPVPDRPEAIKTVRGVGLRLCTAVALTLRSIGSHRWMGWLTWSTRSVRGSN